MTDWIIVAIHGNSFGFVPANAPATINPEKVF
jgi:hypothetical protein